MAWLEAGTPPAPPPHSGCSAASFFLGAFLALGLAAALALLSACFKPNSLEEPELDPEDDDDSSEELSGSFSAASKAAFSAS